MGLKIVMRDYEKSQEEIRLHAIRLMLRETANPNLPMIPGARTPCSGSGATSAARSHGSRRVTAFARSAGL